VKKTSIEPSISVPKKYRKYANAYRDRELYKVERHVKRGYILTCFGCGREIPSLTEFTALLYRFPKTEWSGKKMLPLCSECSR